MIALLLMVLSLPAMALEVVCTLPHLGDIAHRIAPDAHVVILARGTDDPHFLSPTPALIAQVAKADLYVENGLGLELWSERLLDSAGNPGIRPGQAGYVRSTDGVVRLEVPTDLTRAKGDLHPEGNPHVWTDPLNSIQIADNIAAGLSRIDAVNVEKYSSNVRMFRAAVEAQYFGADLVGFMGGDLLLRLEQQRKLDAFLAAKGLTARVGGWKKAGAPLNGKPIIFYHQSWAYFVNRFGVKVAAYVEDRPGIPPTAAHRDQLIALIKSGGIRVIEVTNYYDDAVPKLLAQATGAKVARTAGNVGGTPEATDYFAYVTSLIKAFNQ